MRNGIHNEITQKDNMRNEILKDDRIHLNNLYLNQIQFKANKK